MFHQKLVSTLKKENSSNYITNYLILQLKKVVFFIFCVILDKIKNVIHDQNQFLLTYFQAN